VDTQTQHELAISELLPIAKQSEAYSTTIDSIDIHDDDALAMVGDLKKDLSHYRRKLEDKRTSLVGPLKKVTGDIDAMFKVPRDRIDAVLDKCKKKMNEYVFRQEKIKRDLRLQEEADAREREQRLRAAAETTREETHNPDDDIAAVLDEQADTAAAEAQAAPPKSAPVRGTRSTVSTSRAWRATVVDIKAVCQAIADGVLPVSLVTVSQSDIDGMARAVEKECTRHGIEYYVKVSTTVR
jgi:type IV secretory pathway VirB10-like protein